MPDTGNWMQKTDILIGIGVIAIVVMLVIPLPTFLLDFFLAISIMFGLMILLIVMFVPETVTWLPGEIFDNRPGG